MGFNIGRGLRQPRTRADVADVGGEIADSEAGRLSVGSPSIFEVSGEQW